MTTHTSRGDYYNPQWVWWNPKTWNKTKTELQMYYHPGEYDQPIHQRERMIQLNS